MENWLIIVFTLCIAAILKAFFNLVFSSRKLTHSLPPSPSAYVLIVKYLLLRESYLGFEPILRDLHARFGPIVSLGSRHAIFVSDHSLAHQALVQNGVVFADRPVAGITKRIISNNQRTIGSAAYGPLWRVLRRNLTSEILHPSRAKSYSHARKWVLQVLKQQLINGESGVPVVNHLRYAMFCLLVLMCFGDKLDEHQVKKIEDVQRCVLLNFEKFNILNFCPPVTRILFYKKWERFREICKNQADVLIPLIRARKKVKEEKANKNEDEQTLSYVDTLLDLELPEEKRKLTEEEIISLCSEFLNGGTDTTSTTLQWIMANLVKYQHIQEKLYMEIKSVVGERAKEVQQDDLQKMPYLKAVILEGLRRHPPTHFLLPHRVREDFILNNFLVPREGTVYFSIADMGRDPKVWEDPMVFKSERFLSEEGFDLTGSKEIKMVPFGAGRRICPGMGLAMLHLEYFVANLIWSFEWKPVDGDDVDLSEKQEFTIVMKTPLRVQIHSRV